MANTKPQTAPHIALLAPVPVEHLLSALDVLEIEDKVAFGSNAFLEFHELESERGDCQVDVYIYASAREQHPDAAPLWRAVYLQYRECDPHKLGSHPDGMRFRPKSTEKYPADNQGHWGGFWEVTNLRPATGEDLFSITEMRGFRTKKRYSKNPIPERPFLIQHPIG